MVGWLEAFYMKQLVGIGLPGWWRPPKLPVIIGCVHLEVYIMGSDQGPDQVKCMKLIQDDTANYPYVTLFQSMVHTTQYPTHGQTPDGQVW